MPSMKLSCPVVPPKCSMTRLGCDYELYVHSGLHAKPSMKYFNNEDLDHA